ncbi:MerR family transcriptional regulator [Staphylococcus ureilyticus]|uniref:MerR family transcriptional regulator n=1 Tax=Staphylococcaceae TaxID=90964 RepID=UPI0030C14E8B
MIIYQIGHIVKHFNVSRRTLHFYHDLGLLSPSYIKGNGYRYYNDNDLIKLQTILSLKDLGLNLEEIKQFFNQNENSWLTLLEKQIDVVTEKWSY